MAYGAVLMAYGLCSSRGRRPACGPGWVGENLSAGLRGARRGDSDSSSRRGRIGLSRVGALVFGINDARFRPVLGLSVTRLHGLGKVLP